MWWWRNEKNEWDSWGKAVTKMGEGREGGGVYLFCFPYPGCIVNLRNGRIGLNAADEQVRAQQ